jgi:hypothetical protein
MKKIDHIQTSQTEKAGLKTSQRFCGPLIFYYLKNLERIFRKMNGNN